MDDLLTDQEPAVDPLALAVGGEPAAAADPAGFIDEAVADGTAAPEDVATETPEALKAQVKDWLLRTQETADFKAACKQRDLDLLVILGGTQAEIDDEARITVNHVYRNTMQTVALTVPEHLSVKWSPREEIGVMPGQMLSPQITQALDERKRKQKGTALVIETLMKRFGQECNLQEKIEGFVQDGSHFRASILKVWFQFDFEADPVSEERLPDAQDNHADLRTLVIRYNRGEFTKDDADHQKMVDLLATMNRTELEVKCGIVVESIPLDQYRVDPSVTAPEHHYTAAWERHDVTMRRTDVLSKFPAVQAADLDCCDIMAPDEAGKLVRQRMDERTSTTEVSVLNNPKLRQGDRASKPDDWILVSEIYDYQTNHRLTLIDGLEYPAAKVPLEKQPFGNSPFVCLILNRMPMRWYGISDTEMQGKIQAALNRLRTNEEEARDNAQPRWAYDPAVIGEKALESAKKAQAWTFNPVPVTGKGTLTEALVPLAGNHEFNPAEYDITRLLTEMRAMAMLPEQALGVTGAADFAKEVEVAAAGATIMAKYRMARIKRALRLLFDKCAQLILWNVGVDKAVQYAGPLAAEYWPKEPMQRWEIYETLKPDVEVAMDRQLDYAKRTQALVQVLEALGKIGVPMDKELLGRLLIKYLDLGEEGQQLVQADPNDLVQRLVDALQKNPGAVSPEAMMALAQLGQQAQDAVMAMAEQTAAAEGGASAGGGAAGGGDPQASIASTAGAPMEQAPPLTPEAQSPDVAGNPQQ
jgi:hypothetical protein